jgi:hypothetical protein
VPNVTLGPGYMPPQGARALIGALVGGRRNGPEVAATLDESGAGDAVLEFVNEGIAAAVALRCLYRDPTGGLVARPLGNVPPGGAASCRVRLDAGRTFQCVWVCEGRRGGRLWSYDGRRRRVRGTELNDDVALFDGMYR